jgi:hypothetical protein
MQEDRMPYLPFISDDEFLLHVKSVLDKGINKQKESIKTFNKNVIDPFGSIFESAIKEISLEDWKVLELQRQGQKTIQKEIIPLTYV